MRNQNRCAVLHHIVQASKNLLLGIGVVTEAKRVVEDQDRRLAQQSACDCCALLLSTGERQSAFADYCVESGRELADLGRDVRSACCTPRWTRASVQWSRYRRRRCCRRWSWRRGRSPAARSQWPSAACAADTQRWDDRRSARLLAQRRRASPGIRDTSVVFAAACRPYNSQRDEPAGISSDTPCSTGAPVM